MIVSGPDGKTISFPDSMSPSDVNSAMEQIYPGSGGVPAGGDGTVMKEAPPQTTGAKRALALTSNAVVGGLDTFFGFPGSAGELVESGVNRLDQALGGKGVPQRQGHSLIPLPTIGDLHDFTGRLGLTNRADTVSGWGENPNFEKYYTAGLSGGASALPGALMPGSSAVRTLASGVLGGLGGELGAEAAPGNPLAPVAGGLLGGMAVKGVSKSEGRLPAIAKSLSPAQDLESAGESAQEGARRWLAPLPTNGLDRASALSANNTLDAKLANAWAPVDAAVPGDAPARLDNFKSVLGDLTKGAGGLTDAAKVITPSLPARLQKALSGAGWGPSGAPVTWADLQEFRSRLGDAMKNPQVIKDLPAEQLSALYNGLTRDMETVAGAHGAGDAFALANQESQRLYAVAQGPVAKLVAGARASGSDPLPGKAAKSLLNTAKTDGSELEALRGEIPTAADQLASAHLLQTPEGWAKLSPRAKAALVPDPAKRASIEAAMPGADHSTFLHTLQSLAGGSVGEAFGGLLPHEALPAGAPAAMHVLGFAAPAIYRGARSMLHDPSQLGLPLQGALSGANALFQGIK